MRPVVTAWAGRRLTQSDRAITALADPSGQAPRLRYSLAASRAVGSAPMNQQVGSGKPARTTPRARKAGIEPAVRASRAGVNALAFNINGDYTNRAQSRIRAWCARFA